MISYLGLVAFAIAVPFLYHSYDSAEPPGEVAVTSNEMFVPAQTAVLLVSVLMTGQFCANKICETPIKAMARNNRICNDIFIRKNARIMYILI